MPPLSDDAKRLLLRLARQTLIEHLDRGDSDPPCSEIPALNEPRATFVTLRRRDTGELRGCRGETRARRPLIESVARQVIASATDDPRFVPVACEEVASLQIRISVLTPMRRLRPDDVVLGRHGLLLMRGRRSGLLLPQVPAYYGMTEPKEFLDALCRKAGLPRGSWSEPDAVLLGFEAEDCCEPDPDRSPDRN